MSKLAVVPKPDMESDFDAFASENKRQHGPKCSLCSLPVDLLTLITNKRAEGHQGSLIARYLRSRGVNVLDATVNRHFREGHVSR